MKSLLRINLSLLILNEVQYFLELVLDGGVLISPFGRVARTSNAREVGQRSLIQIAPRGFRARARHDQVRFLVCAKGGHHMPGRSLTIEQVLTLLAETPPRLAALTAGLAPEELQTRPTPDEWSAGAGAGPPAGVC